MEITKLNSILIKHKKWLNGETEGVPAYLSGADLSGADLSRANLSGADLSRADLSRADLSRANLSGADLSGADLSRANLSGADLSGANLFGADLSRADLSGADLSRANLSRADLFRADLSRADLSGADLFGADLSRADLSEAVGISKQTLNRICPLVCPEEGSFIGWKKARNNSIVKLKITEEAKRLSAFGRKCRCSEAVVLAIENIDGTPSGTDTAFSIYDSDFVYKIGEVVTVPDFNDDRFIECGAGIHFFITRQEAVDYR